MPILAMGAGVYALRLSGLVLRDIAVPPALERAFGLVPVALLTALIVTGLTGSSEGGTDRLIAGAIGALAAWWSGRMWAWILAGMVAYWLVRLL